ncbi:hypothetical protein EIL50_01860 [bacterium NHP-B]|nr:hypothetical protein EIL50_01860 [bacterium NHP-B]
MKNSNFCYKKVLRNIFFVVEGEIVGQVFIFLSFWVAMCCGVHAMPQAQGEEGPDASVTCASSQAPFEKTSSEKMINDFPDEILLKILCYACYTGDGRNRVYFEIDATGALQTTDQKKETPFFCSYIRIDQVENVCTLWKRLVQDILCKELLFINWGVDDFGRFYELTPWAKGVSLTTPLSGEIPFKKIYISGFDIITSKSIPLFKNSRLLGMHGSSKSLDTCVRDRVEKLFSNVMSRPSEDSGSLRTLNVSRIDLGASVDKWTSFLSFQKKLTTLKLKYCKLSSDCEEGPSAEALGQVIKNVPLTCFELVERQECHGQFSDESNVWVQRFSEEKPQNWLFYMGNFFPHTLTTLHIKAEGARFKEGFLADLSQLKSLYLEQVLFSQKEYARMLADMKLKKHMTSLSFVAIKILKANPFVLEFSDILKHLPPALESLHLDNRLTMEGAFTFPPALKRLHMKNAVSSGAMLSALQASLPPKITYLDISFALHGFISRIKQNEIRDFLRDASMDSMEELILGQSQIGLKAMMMNVMFIARNKDQQFPKLRRLDLRGCASSTKARKEFKESIENSHQDMSWVVF